MNGITCVVTRYNDCISGLKISNERFYEKRLFWGQALGSITSHNSCNSSGDCFKCGWTYCDAMICSSSRYRIGRLDGIET